MIVLIDDERYLKEADLIVRNYQSALNFLDMIDMSNEHIEGILLDHDLGDDDPSKNGYSLLVQMLDNGIYPNWIKVVSSNPVGRDNIYRACDNNKRYGFNHTLQRYELKRFE